MTDDNRDLPPFPTRPRNGVYRTFHPGSQRVDVHGEYRNGRPCGTWKRFWPSGELRWEVAWRDGVRHGPARGFHENGTPAYAGEYVGGARHGVWEYWYDDGAFRQRYQFEQGEKVGEYVSDQRDGSPWARGHFSDGELHGTWEWWAQSPLPHVRRDYYLGQTHGSEEAWYDNGQLAYRREYVRGHRTSAEEFYEDGSPKLRGTYSAGTMVREETWDETGNRSVAETGLSNELVSDRDRLEELAAQLSEAEDHRKRSVLRDVVDGPARNSMLLLLHLFREDIYDLGADPSLWRFASEKAQEFSGEDVAKLLRQAKPDEAAQTLLPGWPVELDELVMQVYARDPEPIDAVRDELDEPRKVGVTFCQARFGRGDARDTVGDQAAALASQNNLTATVLWPDDESYLRTHAILDGPEPTDAFAEFLSFLTTPEAYEKALLSELQRQLDAGERDVYVTRFLPALRWASVEQLGQLFAVTNPGDYVEELLLQTRGDSAEDLTGLALSIPDHKFGRWPLAACAILARAEEGLGISDELAWRLELGMGKRDLSWVRDRLEELPDDRRHDPAWIDETIRFTDRDEVGGPLLQLRIDALRALDADQRERLIHGVLDRKLGKAQAAPYLFLIEDRSFWEEAIATIAKSKRAGSTVAFGLGLLPLEALELIREAEKAAKKKHRPDYQFAALFCVTRALERNGELDSEVAQVAWEVVRRAAAGEAWDEKDWTSDVMPLVRKALHHLPRARAEELLLALLDVSEPQVFARAFRFIGSHPTLAVREKAMEGLLEVEMELPNKSRPHIQAGLLSFPASPVDERRAHLKWLLANGAGSMLASQLEAVAGDLATLKKLRKEVTEEGAEVAKELDAIDRLLALAERVTSTVEGPTVKIYVLRPTGEAQGDSPLNRIWGLPPGVTAEDWPRRDGEPMDHLFTLDLDAIPELKSRRGGRTLSFFCLSPQHNDAGEAGNDQTAMITVAEQALEQTAPAPEGMKIRREQSFETIEIEVPEQAFRSSKGALGELRGAIYSVGARVLGEPLWLQGNEGGSDFIMQFDESFVDINLGDMGIMYVFADTAYWQCY